MSEITSPPSGFEYGENPRDFKIETISWDNHQLACASIESRATHAEYTPDDWQEQLAPYLDNADLVFPAYFPPELEQTVYNSRLFGKAAAEQVDKHYEVYQQLAEMAAEKDKEVAVADPANSITYMGYEVFLPIAAVNVLSGMQERGMGGLALAKAVEVLPHTVDSRRMLTAAGIKQEADRHPEGARFLYVAAPAHVEKVQTYITDEHSRLDEWRYKAYKHAMPGVDKSLRKYRHSFEKGWQLTSREPIE